MEDRTWPEGDARTPKHATLVIAFQGWSDAGDAASMALDHLRRQSHARKIATIDPDEYFDFTVVRPAIHLDRAGVRKLSWPDTRFYLATNEGVGNDILYCVGIEPQLRWKHFTRAIVRTANEFRVDNVISLGALASEVPHTRDVRIVGTTYDESLGRRLNMQPSRYEGPTGILGVLQSAFQGRKIPSVSLWANVPHYVAQTPSPKAALALVRRTSIILAKNIDTATLESAATEYEAQIDEMVAADDEIRTYIEHLENAGAGDDFEMEVEPASNENVAPLTLASADELATEAERFLRQHGTPDS